MPKPSSQRDEFTEQYIAGILADAGWSVYFPRKDKGFDFVISKKKAEAACSSPPGSSERKVSRDENGRQIELRLQR